MQKGSREKQVPEIHGIICLCNFKKGLVGDAQVVELLLEQLLKKEYSTGVLVDGFPR